MKKFWPAVLLLTALIILLGGILIFKKEEPEKISQKGGETKEMETPNLGKVLMVVAPQNFRDEEYQKPRQVLEAGGWQIEVASRGVNEAVGMFGAKAKIDKDISQVNVDDYLGVVFVGGTGAAIYFEDQTALTLAKTAFEKGKVVGAICIAPSILANAGILEGKRATAFSSEQENLTAKGAFYTGQSVTVDGKIVTANGPAAAGEFGEKILSLLK
jgi:protease I